MTTLNIITLIGCFLCLINIVGSGCTALLAIALKFPQIKNRRFSRNITYSLKNRAAHLQFIMWLSLAIEFGLTFNQNYQIALLLLALILFLIGKYLCEAYRLKKFKQDIEKAIQSELSKKNETL